MEVISIAEIQCRSDEVMERLAKDLSKKYIIHCKYESRPKIIIFGDKSKEE